MRLGQALLVLALLLLGCSAPGTPPKAILRVPLGARAVLLFDLRGQPWQAVERAFSRSPLWQEVEPLLAAAEPRGALALLSDSPRCWWLALASSRPEPGQTAARHLLSALGLGRVECRWQQGYLILGGTFEPGEPAPDLSGQAGRLLLKDPIAADFLVRFHGQEFTLEGTASLLKPDPRWQAWVDLIAHPDAAESPNCCYFRWNDAQDALGAWEQFSDRPILSVASLVPWMWSRLPACPLNARPYEFDPQQREFRKCRHGTAWGRFPRGPLLTARSEAPGSFRGSTWAARRLQASQDPALRGMLSALSQVEYSHRWSRSGQGWTYQGRGRGTGLLLWALYAGFSELEWLRVQHLREQREGCLEHMQRLAEKPLARAGFPADGSRWTRPAEFSCPYGGAYGYWLKEDGNEIWLYCSSTGHELPCYRRFRLSEN